MPKILILPGSARRDSLNRKLAAAAAQFAAEAGAEVDLIDPADFAMPIFCEEIEEASGLPDAAKALKARITAADAILFVSPEYNSSVTPLMKNLIDWVSRTEDEDEPALSAYRGKVAGLLAASPGALGGLRGLVHLRSILGNIGVLVAPRQFAMGSAHDKFDAVGALTDESARKAVRGVVDDVVKLAGKLT